jgi:alpha-glucosidase
LNGRDKCRTPMQWRNAPNAGFCPDGVAPWLPVNPNFASGINGEDQRSEPDSLLNYYRTLLGIRRKTPALVEGVYLPLLEDQHDVFAFLRKTDGQICLVLLNMSERFQKVCIQKGSQRVQLIYSNRSRLSAVDSLAEIPLKPFEVYIARTE